MLVLAGSFLLERNARLLQRYVFYTVLYFFRISFVLKDNFARCVPAIMTDFYFYLQGVQLLWVGWLNYLEIRRE